jgi:OmpA-OmpF porin, OOP family
MKTLLLSALLLLAGTTVLFAQAEDYPGCKDHPLLNRMPNFLIQECSQNFNTVDIQTGTSAKKETIEGTVTKIVYGFNSESGAKMPSGLQIVRNYEAAIIGNGGKKVYSGVDDIDGGTMGGTYSMTKAGKEYWVTVRKFYVPQMDNEIGAYDLYVIEKEPMKQDVLASELFDGLNKNGSVALYINFATGRATIESESQSTVDEIGKMLTANPSLKISIEGHTDNAGTATANKTLSENRAKSVLGALVAKGIDAGRLSAKGWGQEKPIADNATDEGKAKNRRVEIVKQ